MVTILLQQTLRVHVHFFHQHREGEAAAFVHTVRLHVDLSTILLNDLLADAQTQAQPLRIQTCCALQFTEEGEQGIHVARPDPDARVLAHDDHGLLGFVVAHDHVDPAVRRRELESVSY